MGLLKRTEVLKTTEMTGVKRRLMGVETTNNKKTWKRMRMREMG